MANHSALERSLLCLFAISCFLLVYVCGQSLELGSSSFSFGAQMAKPLLGKNCDTGMAEECDAEENLASSWGRRRLLQQSDPNYISYGSLTADRTPCPPMSGRSYYTQNCNSASGPVDPYQRGCSAITRCARDTS